MIYLYSFHEASVELYVIYVIGVPGKRHQGCSYLHRARTPQDSHCLRRGLRPEEAGTYIVRLRRLSYQACCCSTQWCYFNTTVWESASCSSFRICFRALPRTFSNGILAPYTWFLNRYLATGALPKQPCKAGMYFCDIWLVRCCVCVLRIVDN